MGKCLPLHSLLRSKPYGGKGMRDETTEEAEWFAAQILKEVKTLRKICEIQIKVVPLQNFPPNAMAIEKAEREH